MDANPWVEAYTFTVQAGNIDRLDAGIEPLNLNPMVR
jgi:hypothetical protein